MVWCSCHILTKLIRLRSNTGGKVLMSQLLPDNVAFDNKFVRKSWIQNIRRVVAAQRCVVQSEVCAVHTACCLEIRSIWLIFRFRLFLVLMFCLFVCRMAKEAQTYAEDTGLLFMETSAKTAMNVNELFLAIGEWPLISVWICDFKKVWFQKKKRFTPKESSPLTLNCP